MPVKSEAQRRFMYAVEEGKVEGVEPSVGKEFIEATPKGKKLPEKVESKKGKRHPRFKRKSPRTRNK